MAKREHRVNPGQKGALPTIPILVPERMIDGWVIALSIPRRVWPSWSPDHGQTSQSAYPKTGRRSPRIRVAIGVISLALGLGAIETTAALSPTQVAQSSSESSSESSSKSSSENLSVCKRSPQEYLNQLLADPDLRRSHWGILIQPLPAASDPAPPSPEPWLSHNAEQFFNPASNAKLLTTAAVLTHLGQYHYVNTTLALEPSSQSPPSLRIHTLGNPALSQSALDHFAAAVKQKGLIAVDTVWVDAEDIGLVQEGRISSWEWGDLPFGYGAPASTAVFNNNQLTLILTGTEPGQGAQVEFSDPIAAQQWNIHNQVLTDDDAPAQITVTAGWPNTLHLTGTLPSGETDQTFLAVPNPPQYLGDAFKHTLEQQGISVAQVRISRNARIQPSQGHSVLTSYSSPSSGDLVTTINRFSNNLYAEVLLGWLGRIGPSLPGLDTPAGRSRQALEEALTQLGVSPSSYRVADGSGLSRQNLVTPQGLVQLLTGMWRSPESVPFQRSLPIAGETGTLRNRFKGTPLEGTLIAKTGTLTGVSALSGYFPHGNHRVAFSILVNHSNQPASVLRQGMDDLLVAIAETPSQCLSIK